MAEPKKPWVRPEVTRRTLSDAELEQYFPQVDESDRKRFLEQQQRRSGGGQPRHAV